MHVSLAKLGSKQLPTLGRLRPLASTMRANATSAASSRETQEDSVPKLVVFGGNGFVGSHVCQAAIQTGLSVVSVNRSGKPANQETAWTDQVEWVRGDASQPDSYRHLFSNCLGVISCVGTFGSNEFMYKVNGEANKAAVQEAASAGVERFAYISAHDYRFPGDLLLLKGYFEGKRATEQALQQYFPMGGVYLQPGFIHGTRKVGSIAIPLGVVGAPLEGLLSRVPSQSLAQIPLLGAAFVPPVSAQAVGKAAVAAATDPSVPAGAMDVWAIEKYT